jgi:hypothetical protein
MGLVAGVADQDPVLDVEAVPGEAVPGEAVQGAAVQGGAVKDGAAASAVVCLGSVVIHRSQPSGGDEGRSKPKGKRAKG